MAQRKIIWSTLAIASLRDILLFYKIQNGNNDYSNKLLHQIKESVLLLGAFPNAGKSTSMYEIRELVLKRNSVFYLVASNQINIVLVWDNRRNPDELFAILNS